MKHFGKHLMSSLLWLIASEILCLILAFSLAILPDHPVIRVIGLLFGITAHVLLIGNCAQKAAADDLILYRTSKYRTQILKPLLIAILLTLPSYLTYFLLSANPESILMMNLFSLLNAPFIRIYKLLRGDAETFSALSAKSKIIMVLPPVLTAAAYYISYHLRYHSGIAAYDTRTNR